MEPEKMMFSSFHLHNVKSITLDREEDTQRGDRVHSIELNGDWGTMTIVVFGEAKGVVLPPRASNVWIAEDHTLKLSPRRGVKRNMAPEEED